MMRRAVMLFAAISLAVWAAPPLRAQNAATGSPGRGYVVFFQEWSAALDAPALQAIAAAAAIAAKTPDAPITVTGYADPLGSVQANIYLTETRAQVVTDQLTADGVNPARIHQRAAGKVGFQLTSQESRRVVITIGGS
ncbi:MAG TPA: OmpA family protein [Acetobacteraceae bacterium]|nr:OmpA family protein [Acetobacteraceae bacterium]